MSECSHWTLIFIAIISAIVGYVFGWRHRGEEEKP